MVDFKQQCKVLLILLMKPNFKRTLIYLPELQHVFLVLWMTIKIPVVSLKETL